VKKRNKEIEMAEQDLAMQVLEQVVKLPVVKVDRSKFLVDKFSKELDPKDISTLLEQGPSSLLSQEILDRVANACIMDNVLLASGTSVLAGLPGGLAMAITIPADVAQFYAFSLKLAQELGYIYGYDDLWASRDELSEDAQNTLLLYLGVMLGVNGTAAFSDELRDALRGPFSDDRKGAFLAGIKGEEESLKFGIVGAIAHPDVDMSKVNYSKEPWAVQPTQQISYVSCHDDMCLTDRLRASVPGIQDDELIRLDLLAQTAVFTSQGVPFILSGEEMLRNKQGVHNSFNSPIDINALNWAQLKEYPQVFAYYQRLIALRRHHPAFRLGNANLIRQHLSFLPTQPNLVGFMLTGHAGGDVWNNIIVVFNANNEARGVTVPKGRYTIVASNGTINETGWGSVETDHLWVDAHSMLIAHQ